MGLNINSATEIIKDFLVDNLVDPLNARATAWIYSDGMRIDLDKSPYPKILLKKTDEPSLKEQLAIGNVSTENRDEIFIEIKMKAGEHLTIDSVDYTATQAVSEIARQAENLIKNNHTYFVNQGFLDVIMVKDLIEVDRDKNPTYRLGIQMHYISTPN